MVIAAPATILELLVQGAITGTGGYLAQSALKDIAKYVWGDGEITDQLASIEGQIQELKLVAKEILEQLKGLELAIEFTIIDEQLKIPFSTINADSENMYAYIKAVKDGDYKGDDEKRKDNYKGLSDDFAIKIPDASERISESDLKWLEIIQAQSIKQKMDVFSYHLTLSYRLNQLWDVYKKAIDLLQFSSAKHPYLSNVIPNTQARIETLGVWKNQYVLGTLTPLVAAFFGGKNGITLPSDFVNFKYRRWSVFEAKPPPIKLAVIKAENFTWSDPIVILQHGGELLGSDGTHMETIPGTGKAKRESSRWKLHVAESSVVVGDERIVSAEETKQTFCLLNTYSNKYWSENNQQQWNGLTNFDGSAGIFFTFQDQEPGIRHLELCHLFNVEKKSRLYGREQDPNIAMWQDNRDQDVLPWELISVDRPQTRSFLEFGQKVYIKHPRKDLYVNATEDGGAVNWSGTAGQDQEFVLKSSESRGSTACIKDSEILLIYSESKGLYLSATNNSKNDSWAPQWWLTWVPNVTKLKPKWDLHG